MVAPNVKPTRPTNRNTAAVPSAVRRPREITLLYLLTAIIRPSRVEDVRDALEGAGLTVTEVHGFSRQRGHVETYRGAEYQIELVPKVRVEVLVEADDADDVVARVREAAHSGRLGDGKIWLSPLTTVVRVRTGEQGAVAI
jgi:nitrogen regulatory protein P-II 1